MAEPSSVEDLRRGYKAFADNDLATLTEIIPENAVWHVPGRSPLAGDHRGRDAVFAYFMKLTELTGGTFKAELVHAVGDDEYAVALQRSTATHKGREYSSFDVLVDRLENGKAVETWVWSEKPYEFDDLLS
jgi:ketosteroid isomerase-like protein